MENYQKQFLQFLKRGAVFLFIIAIVTSLLGIFFILTSPTASTLKGLGLSLGLLSIVAFYFGLKRFRFSEKDPIQSLLGETSKRRKSELMVLVLGIVLCIWAGIFWVNAFNLGLGMGLSIQASLLLVDSLILQWRTSLFEYEQRRRI